MNCSCVCALDIVNYVVSTFTDDIHRINPGCTLNSENVKQVAIREEDKSAQKLDPSIN